MSIRVLYAYLYVCIQYRIYTYSMICMMPPYTVQNYAIIIVCTLYEIFLVNTSPTY